MDETFRKNNLNGRLKNPENISSLSTTSVHNASSFLILVAQ